MTFIAAGFASIFDRFLSSNAPQPSSLVEGKLVSLPYIIVSDELRIISQEISDCLVGTGTEPKKYGMAVDVGVFNYKVRPWGHAILVKIEFPQHVAFSMIGV